MSVFSKIKANPLYRKALLDTNYYFVAQLGLKLLGLLVIPFLARILTIEEFAHYDMFLMTAAIIQLVVSLGVDSGMAIMIADHRKNHTLINYLFSVSFYSSIIAVLVLWFLSFVFFPVFKEYVFIVRYIQYIFLFLLFNLISTQIFSFLRWMGKAKVAAFISFFSSAVGVLLGFCLIYFKKSPFLSDYLFGMVVGNLVGAILSVGIAYKHLVFKWNSEFNGYIKELFTVSLPFIPNYIASSLMIMADRLVILSVFGEKELAIYALANRFAQIPKFALDVITKGFHPVMYHNYKEPSGILLIKRMYNYSHYVLIPILILMIGLAAPIVKIFGGEKFSEATSLIPIVTVSSLIYGIMSLNGMGYTIKRKTKFHVFVSSSGILLNVAFNWILGSLFGIGGIAIGSLVATGITSLVYTHFSEKLYSFELNYRRSLAIYLATLIISIVILLSYNGL